MPGKYPVAILMGSDSDYPRLQKAEQILQEEFQIPVLVDVISAHRTPERLHEFVQQIESHGIEIIIAGAGAAAHLPGVLASLTDRPVIGVPLDATPLKGVDALYSIVQMPPGVPVATVGIDNPTNAALLAVRILALSRPDLRKKLHTYIQKMKERVREKARKLQELRATSTSLSTS